MRSQAEGTTVWEDWAYWDPHGIYAPGGKPLEISVGDPCIPMVLQDFLCVRTLGDVQVALTRWYCLREWCVCNPPLQDEPTSCPLGDRVQRVNTNSLPRFTPLCFR